MSITMNKSEYQWITFEDATAKFYCINDVKDVIAGKKIQNPADLWLNANDYSYGLGDGSLDVIQDLGEAALVNGLAYTKQTNALSKSYYQMNSGQRFMTSWAFLMSKHARPNATIFSSNLSKAISVTKLYKLIAQQIKKPFFVVGIVHDKSLEEAAIAKAPIYGENIFTHQAIYYPHQNKLFNQSSCIIGVVASDVPAILAEKMSKVVYVNPLEAADDDNLNTHTHVLSLTQKLHHLNEVVSATVTDVEHFFENTQVDAFNLNIYCIEDIEMVTRGA